MISFLRDTNTMGEGLDGFQSSGPAPLVVKLGGAALDEPESCHDLWDALAAIHQAEPGGLVLVHGGGKAVDRKFAALGYQSERREGIRITPPEHIEEVVAVLAGVSNTHVVGRMQAAGAPAVGLCLGDGFFTRTVKSTRYEFDPGRVGEIKGGDAKLITTLLGAGFMPVLSSIGLDEQGHFLNVNADEAAAAVAAILGARELVLLTDVAGVLNDAGEVIRTLDEMEIDRLIASGAIWNGMIPKVHGALEAANAAGAPAVIASWKDPAALMKAVHGEPAGTRVLPSARTFVKPISAVAV